MPRVRSTRSLLMALLLGSALVTGRVVDTASALGQASKQGPRATAASGSSIQGAGRGAIDGQVWYRRDSDPGDMLDEAGIEKATIALHKGACALPLGSPQRKVSTSAGGHYRFEDLGPGDYCLSLDEESLPGSMTNVSDGSLLQVRVEPGGIHGANDFHYAPSTVRNRLVVSLATCEDTAWLERQASGLGAVISGRNHSGCLFVVQAPSSQAAALQSTLLKRGDVRSAELDVRVRGELIPNDPDYSDTSLSYAPRQIHAEEAWDYTTGEPSVIVAVVDTGIDPDHVEFRGSLLPGYDYVNDDASPADDHGHGTHVAGIIGAGMNNAVGMAGIAASSSLLPLKVLDSNSVGYSSNVALAIMDSVDQGARVVNLSLSTATDSTVLHEAVRYAAEHGVLVVAAAGNHSSDMPRFPASYTDGSVLAVGATMESGERWPLSDFGPNVEVMAPGNSVYSTHWRQGEQNAYAAMTGTSMAAPHAAASAALLLSLDPTLTPASVIEYLARTATKVQGEGDGPIGYSDYTGHGLINAGAAVRALLDDLDPGDGAIGGSVFWDRDGDGRRCVEEPGIADVEMLLSGDAGSKQMTGPDGGYEFSGLRRGAYVVTIPAHEFGPGGTLEGWQSYPQASAADDTYSAAEPRDHVSRITLDPGERIDDLHFAFQVLPDVQIGLELQSPEPARPGDPVKFALSITNTGHFPIDFLPLRDEYSTRYLSYAGSDPAADERLDDGRVDWADLTETFGRDLAPRAVFSVLITFTAQADTGQLPRSKTSSVASVSDAKAGVWASGELWMEPLPTRSAFDAVRIERADLIAAGSLLAQTLPEGIRLRWQTLSEEEIVGFSVLRRSSGDAFERVNPEPIHVAGGHQSYEFLDAVVLRGQRYEYLLEVATRDGDRTAFAWSPLTSLWWVSLPLLAR